MLSEEYRHNIRIEYASMSDEELRNEIIRIEDLEVFTIRIMELSHTSRHDMYEGLLKKIEYKLRIATDWLNVRRQNITQFADYCFEHAENILVVQFDRHKGQTVKKLLDTYDATRVISDLWHRRFDWEKDFN